MVAFVHLLTSVIADHHGDRKRLAFYNFGASELDQRVCCSVLDEEVWSQMEA